jgi:transcriptional regulator GlxA family with amidase domain
LTRIRIRRAGNLLAETSMPVGQIAAGVGYRQQAQFAKAFTRLHSVPSARYRTDRHSP